MKKFYFTLVFISYSLFLIAQTPTGASTEVGITEGQLSVSLSGGASYSIPIAVPPGINDVVPQVSLSYNSQGGNGLAGYGWNISGVSAITRIPATKFHDGTIDGVDFNALDRFAFDGQRLVVKNGTGGVYGANGTVYETENFSNVKITSFGIHPSGTNFGPAYFIVEYPDGSKAYYGNTINSRTITDWAIEYWENPQGVRISYSYISANNNLSIAFIKYGSTNTNTPLNQIQFVYKTRQRPEQAYVGGQSFINNTILSSINVSSNGVGFRNYTLLHDVTSLGYERLTKMTESGSGDGTKSYNPTLFSYGETNDAVTYSSITTNISVNNISSINSATVTGDFNGDGKMDFLVYPTTGTTSKSKYWLFYNLDPLVSPNLSYEQNIGAFNEIFASSLLTGDAGAGYKLMPKQGWTVIKNYATTTFSNYSAEGGLSPVFLQYEKSYQFPLFSSSFFSVCGSYNPANYVTRTYTVPKKFINGDFNGDGLTDVIAIEKSIIYQSSCDRTSSTSGGQSYFINLDKRLTTNFVTNAGIIIPSGPDKYMVADFNGDGKSDLFVFNYQSVRVYALNDLNQFILLHQNTTADVDILFERPVLMGDYNGDGKSDFIIPKGYGFNFAKYISNGISFIKTNVTYNIDYKTNYISSDAVEINSLIPNDIDGDGKTDLISYGTSGRYSENSAGFRIGVWKNMDTNFVNSASQNTLLISGIQPYAMPIFLTSDRANFSLELGAISNNKICRFNSQKDFNKERLLQKITTGNGVKESITYSPIVNEPCSYNCKPIYSSSGALENYPNMDIPVAPSFQVVSKLEKQSATVYKKQLFAYYGAVSNVEGQGFLGFRASMRTNWHDDTTTIISNISKFDVGLRGAKTENYSVLYYTSPYSNFAPTDFISKSILTYNTAIDALQANKVFKLKNISSQNFNGLETTSSQTTTLYDSYNNPTQATTTVNNGGTLEQTSISNVGYAPVIASPYIVGRPTSKSQSVTISGDSSTSNELYAYTNNLLSQVKKYGNGTTDFITEDNIYDAFGNITKKTIIVPAVTPNPAPAPRITNYEYDPTGRFLTKTIDIEGLATTFVYNTSNGLLISETNPFGLTTSYTYDPWFKKTKTTDYLGKSNTYTYSRSNSVNTVVTSVGDDGSGSEEVFDDMGRKTKSGVKNINSTFSYVDYLYDIYDRNYKVSEPYFGSGPSQWNETQYDVYGRINKTISFTGKSVTMNYNGLVTTAVDAAKTKASTKNAIGNVILMTDTPGGTIIYTYFANGNLKTSNYDGVINTITQDAWGRKTQLVDPSAGTYSYTYNLFGETTSETTPNGTMTYTLDGVGKLTKKTISGNNTSSETTYTYDNLTKLPTATSFKDILNGNAITSYTYEYDTTKRLFKTTEITPYASFIKQLTFDAFGRVDTETPTATILASGKSSAKTIQYTYANGYSWQIKNQATGGILWQTNTVNARGQLISANQGKETIANTYDQYGLATQFKHDWSFNGASGNIMTLNTVFDPQKGNLTSRTNSMFNTTDNFTYDSLDRLTSYPNAIGTTETQTYDNRGRITQNAVGTYNYVNTAKAYQNTSVTLAPESTGYYANREGIFSDSMEEKKGWVIYDPVVFTYDTTEGHLGNTSLKIANTTTTEKVIHSEIWTKIDNIAPTSYTYSAWVKSDTPQAELFLFMKTETETNYFTLVDSKVTNVTNQWTRIEGTFIVPANIKKLNLRLDNNGLGNIWFDDVMIRKTSNAETSDRKLEIFYNTFKSPLQIEETGVDKISFTYNDGNDRSTMFYGGLGDASTRQYRKHYSADGSMEIKENRVTGTVDFITYIGGDAYSAPIILKSDGTTQNYLYLHRDYQGSILAITNDTGQTVEKRLFDAWGNIVLVQDGLGNNLGVLTLIDRGYTGHEHMQNVGLINMNGRLYDPKLHRFLQPDNFVQDPFNTQNYNRYGYCWNNPLKYTDPSGEFIWAVVIVGALIGAATGGAAYVAQAITTGNWNWGQFGLSVLGGAVIGALSSGALPASLTLGHAVGMIATGFVGGLFPAYGVQVGDWSFSISPSIAFGNTAGIGASLSVTYSAGDFSFSAGVGIMSNSNYNGLGKNGMEIRKSILASYDDGKNGVSLGANSWSGTGGMKEFSQRTGVLGIHSGDFRAMYENDGGPVLNKLGDANDSYRTAALNLSVGKFTAGFNLFTGQRNTTDQETEGKKYGFKDSMGVYHQNPATNEQGTKYRLGALTVGYGGYRVGVNSEHVRHAIQNAVIHRMIGDNEFVNTSWDWKGYSQYRTYNGFTSW